MSCSIKCKTCESSVNNCTQCSRGSNRMSNSPCNCLDGYHDNNGTSSNCYKCPKNCKKWYNFIHILFYLYYFILINSLSDDYCLECKESEFRKLDLISGVCKCISGYKMNKIGEC